jgi:biopolymer transport protein ExbD
MLLSMFCFQENPIYSKCDSRSSLGKGTAVTYFLCILLPINSSLYIQLLKLFCCAFVFFSLAGCSQHSLEGLWIAKEEDVLFKFHGDSVLHRRINSSYFNATGKYRVDRDSICFMWNFDPMSLGADFGFRYRLRSNSLAIWEQSASGKPHKTVFHKFNHATYRDYFLKRDQVSLQLPHASNAKLFAKRSQQISLFIGLQSGSPIMFVEEHEATQQNLKRLLRHEAQKHEPWETPIVTIYADSNVPFEYIRDLFDVFRSLGLRKILFAVESPGDDQYNGIFYGIFAIIPPVSIDLEQLN